MTGGALPLLDLPAARPHTVAPATEGDVRRGTDTGRIPHVVAWNLTRRCNLACSHCYISAGDWHGADDELTTEECRRIADQILAINPSPLFILSGGEPLLRDDLEDIARHASARGATVVVGTNGTRLTEARIASLMDAGVRGVAVSIDSLEARYHDRFRHGGGALEDTLAAVDRLARHGLDFIVQTSVTRGNVAEIPAIAAWAAEKGAVCFNVYFLVATGRGAGMAGLTPAENDAVLGTLVELEREYRGRMMVRSKCQPQLMRHALAADADSPLLNYETRCPCGVHYCRITPEGKVTPCPYLPEVAGDLRGQDFADVWWGSSLFTSLREGELGGRCGRCEYRAVCGGCRARAFAESGDPLAEDASCAYEPTGAPLVEPRRSLTYGRAAEETLEWDDDARERIARVPSFVRGVVTARVETFARERGHARVTTDVMDEVRRSLPVDFSKRMPFFLRREAE
ncbi:MAG TPA: radical SAM protein [Longimicrobiales bacterium]|nr:radical SAM protein [Longimicrobiales bacterium]